MPLCDNKIKITKLSTDISYYDYRFTNIVILKNCSSYKVEIKSDQKFNNFGWSIRPTTKGWKGDLGGSRMPYSLANFSERDDYQSYIFNNLNGKRTREFQKKPFP